MSTGRSRATSRRRSLRRRFFGLAPKKRNPATRYDLQGLRGVGVIAVVLGHLFRQPQGVFAALDIFFVLSGFVITAVLLDMDAKHGRIYFTPFYLARVRRLLPMALVVTVATIGLTYYVFSAARGALVAKDGMWSSLFVANWHFANQGTDYFYDASESPFLHYWSLSVEEQFYAVWPALLLVLLFAFRRLRQQRVALFCAVTVVGLISFGYSMWHSVASPTVAYFSTLDRVWEFAVGGLLAIGAPALRRIPPRWGAVMAWAGFWTLTLPIFLLEYGMAFPAPWALAPVLCTAAIVAGGIGRDTRHFVVVDNRLMTYIGDISYSVYLWHLPVIILLKPVLGADTLGYYVGVLAITAVLSVVSYHLIEKPMRYAKWLMTPPERKAQRRRGQRDMTPVRNGWIAVGAVGTVVMCVVALTYDPAPVAAPVAAQVPTAQTEEATPLTPDELRVQRRTELVAALGMSEFPTLDPPLAAMGGANWRNDIERIACAATPLDDPESCFRGSTDSEAPLAIVVGDSVAAAWMPGILDAMPAGWRVLSLTRGECSVWTLPSYVDRDGRDYSECQQYQDLRDTMIEQLRPEIVVISSASEHVRNAERPELETTPTAVAESALGATLARYRQWTERVVVLAPRPRTIDPRECVSRFTGPEACISEPPEMWDQHVEGESAAAAEHGADYVQTLDWFCVDRRCPGVMGGTPVSVDGVHLSIPASQALAPLLAVDLFGTPAVSVPSS